MKSVRNLFSRRRAHDVVFYTPWVGAMISPNASLPPGGAETQVLMLAKALAARSVRVAIVAFGDPGELPEQVDGVSIVPRPPYRRRFRLVGKAVEGFLIWRSLWHAPSRTIVVRGSGIQLGIVAAFARLTRRRFVFSTANIVDFDPRPLLPKSRDRLIHDVGVLLADVVVVQTEEQIERCRAAYRRVPRLIKSIEPLAEPQIATPEAFLWVGRLVSYKRPLEYIDLARSLPEATFWMVGVPMPHHASDRLVTETVISQSEGVPNLTLLEPRRQAEIAKLMLRAVASVNTADFEGMPNVLLEAWTRGVPALVLNYDPGGVVATHGLGGFADGSPERLVSLAREQWATRHERKAVAERCRAYIATHHAPETVAAEWLDVLAIPATVIGRPALEETELTCAG